MTEQPKPIPNEHHPLWESVIEELQNGPFTNLIPDMEQRDRLGRERYGVPLQPFNGRSFSQDAYEECLDLIVYTYGMCAEEYGKNGQSTLFADLWSDFVIAVQLAQRLKRRMLDYA